VDAPLDKLLAHRSAFLGYLRKQGAAPDQAEDILQAALVEELEPWARLPDDERVVGWFYRVLHNALVDHARRRAAAGRALDRLATEVASEAVTEPPGLRRVCPCTRHVLAALKPAYAALLTAVDLEAVPLEEAARAAGITANNAYVRLHRARRALRERLEATCGPCAKDGGCCHSCDCAHDSL
jgi:RNA polymerase sigma-70 factor (ECF subfamily)